MTNVLINLGYTYTGFNMTNVLINLSYDESLRHNNSYKLVEVTDDGCTARSAGKSADRTFSADDKVVLY